MVKPSKNGPEPASAAAESSTAPSPARLFPAGYKTPMSLLNERCQKQGWQSAVVDSKRLPGGKGFTAVVTLRKMNPKTKNLEEVVLRPPGGESPIRIEKETALEARHWGAIYALFRFANNLRLSLTLPPVCRPYWALLEAEKKTTPKHLEWLWSTDPFAAASANAAKPSQTSGTPQSQTEGTSGPQREKPLPKRWEDAPVVHMSPGLRDMVEELISRERERIGDEVDDELEDDGEEKSNETTQLSNELLGMGFRLGQVDAAIQSAKRESQDQKAMREAALVHLQTHVPEEDLPVAFRAHRPTENKVRLFQSGDAKALALGWLADRMNKESGFPIDVIESVLKDLSLARDEAEVPELEGLAYARLGRMMVATEELGGEEKVEDALWEGEREIVKSLLADDRVIENESDVFEIIIKSPIGKKKLRGKDDISLRIFHTNYPAPNVSPSFYVYSSSLPAYIKVHITFILLRKLNEDESFRDIIALGQGGIITELVDTLDTIVDSVIAYPPIDARKVFEPFYGQKKFSFLPTSRSVNGGERKSQRRWKKEFETVEDVGAESTRLLRDWSERKGRSAWLKMLDVRKKLPAWKTKQEIIEAVLKNRVVIIAGDTGSGKTTQVPSYILENAILSNQGAATSMICTQPRRVSAIGVATRVAQELDEDINRISHSSLVGYSIRGEKKSGKGCRLLFCTTGVLLARLGRGGDINLDGVSHVFVDEVHERSTDSDFLLLELREMLKRNSKLKIILMSATINQQFFSDYFGGAPCITIPGFTHPVQDFHLEDVIRITSYHHTSAKPASKLSQPEIERMRSSFQRHGIEDVKALNVLENLRSTILSTLLTRVV
ncbi:hypothetical protein BT69DRAFT_1058380 [Atractiella rhizophila]|nr:hypothetical protein BT69DRAFT_1058380 [Atractiella rhizophila]